MFALTSPKYLKMQICQFFHMGQLKYSNLIPFLANHFNNVKTLHNIDNNLSNQMQEFHPLYVKFLIVRISKIKFYHLSIEN